jgi:hypothetical protein
VAGDAGQPFHTAHEQHFRSFAHSLRKIGIGSEPRLRCFLTMKGLEAATAASHVVLFQTV